MNTKVNECKLISGKEALIALANGEEVEYVSSGMAGTKYWSDSEKTKNFTIHDFYSGYWVFRLKPRTITINGIEVPGIKKESAIYKSHNTVAIVCESFEEAELMCLALRQVFGGSHD